MIPENPYLPFRMICDEGKESLFEINSDDAWIKFESNFCGCSNRSSGTRGTESSNLTSPDFPKFKF